MKTKDELYLVVYLSQDCHVSYSKRIRKVDRKINKTQEHLVTTQAHRRAPGKPGATTLTTYRIPGIPHSAVEQQDTNRRDKVKKLIQHLESHPNKESFLQDLNKTEEINEFSEKSLPRSNALTVYSTGRSALSIVLVEEI